MTPKFKTFKEWFHYEDFHIGYDCNQLVSAKMAWEHRQTEIDELQKENEELKKQIETMKNCYNCVHQLGRTGCKLKDKVCAGNKNQPIMNAGFYWEGIKDS